MKSSAAPPGSSLFQAVQLLLATMSYVMVTKAFVTLIFSFQKKNQLEIQLYMYLEISGFNKFHTMLSSHKSRQL